MRGKVRITIAAGLLALLLTGTNGYRPGTTAAPAGAPFGKQAPAEVSLAATRNTAAGVDPATAFELSAQAPLAAAQVQQQLKVLPAVALRVEQADAGGRKFTVLPDRPLAAGQVYRFSLAAGPGLSRPYGWSFQTRAAFAVLGTLPRGQGTGVPLNTGIEFTFSHDDYADLDPFFAITPAVSGRFERHGRTAVFVPKQALQPSTIYTVTLRRGLKQSHADGELGADTTFRFETAPPPADNPQQAYVYVPTEPQAFATADAPYLQVFAGKMEEAPETAVTVYRYPDAARYISALSKAESVPWWASHSRAEQREDTAGLQQATSFTGKPQRFPGIPSPYLVFPAPLPPGYYLAELKLSGVTRQVHLQVTDISSYTVVTSTDTMVWLNDLTTKAPVAGASVQLPGTATSTDAGGVAVLPTPPTATGDSPAGVYLQVRAGSKEAVVGSGTNRGYYGPQRTELAELYWKYLYLDRSLYKPDDKVGIWGVLAPREPGAAPLTNVTLEVIRSEYTGPDNRPLPLATATAAVHDGTFTAAVDLPGLRPGWYILQVRQGDNYVSSHSFEVANYTKPAYRLEGSASKAAVFTGQAVEFKLTASFFEGTPVPNLPLAYNISWGSGSNDQVRTDAAGSATISFTATPQGGSDGYPSYTYLYAHVSSPEAGEITTSVPLQVFTRNVLFEPKVKVEGGQALLSAELNQVTLDQLNAGTGSSVRGSPAAGLPVKGALSEVHWIQEDAGEAYDFIAKRVYKQYRYRQEFKPVAAWLASSDGNGQVSQSMTVDPKQSYQLLLETQDSNGRPIKRELTLSGRDYAPPVSGYRWFRLQAEGERNTWGLGAPLTLVMSDNSAPLAGRTQGFLFFTARRGLQDYRVQDTARFAYALKQSDLPSTSVRAVYFDGRMYREAMDYTVRFDPKERELQVSVTPDKAVYRPGETVNLAVRLTDRQGQPVQGQVNLNLVDEALYALRDEQQVDLLRTLYGEWIGSGILASHSSHGLPEPGSGAEKGGEGGGMRKDFRDAIFFASLSTDADGRASASFQVPDNLTSWRVTYQAIEPKGLQAVSGTTAIPVRLPFFVHLVIGDTYLAGDQPVALVTSFGTGLHDGQSVEYAVQITGPDGASETVKASGAAFAPVRVQLPQLKTGGYQVTVAATAGDLHDTLQLPVRAVDSFLRTTRADYFLLGPDTHPAGAQRGLTTLTFTDHQRSRYLALLNRLQWQWGSRLEQQLSRAVAADLRKQYFAGQETPAPFDSFSFQAPDGSIAILPYSDGTVELSALAADLAPQRFDRAALEVYLQKLVETPGTSRERTAAALYGLAALGRPVLLSVQTRLQASDLSTTEQLYLGLAAASLGELEGARTAYQGLLGAQGEQIGRDARLKVSDSQDEILGATALIGVLAAKLGEPQAPAFAGYLLATPATEVLLSLEEALLAAHGLRQLAAEPASFSYTLDGKTLSQQVGAGTPVRLSLTAAQLAGLRFTDIKGQVGLTVTYEAPLNTATVKPEAGFNVSRTYSVDGKPLAGALKPGDLVEVTLRYTIPASAPGGGYEVTDYLPAGLRLVQRPWQYGAKSDQGAWPLQVDGQRVSFWAGGRADPIRYYARVASPGQYTAEQTVLSHTASGTVLRLGERQQVTIQ